MTGAAAATAMRMSRNPRPTAGTHAMRRRAPTGAGAATASAGADARVEEAIHQVDGEVHGDEHERREEDRALHDGIVAVVDRLDRQPPDPRPGEDGLGHHG